MRGELPPAAFHERPHEQIERAARPRGSLGPEGLDPDTEVWRQAVARYAGCNLCAGCAGCLILLAIRAVAEPVLEVDPEILNGLALELFFQAREHALVNGEIERGSECPRVGGTLGQRLERQLAPFGGEPRPEQVRADVRGMDRAAPGKGRHARFPQKSRKS